jgi:hypothetical protein
LVLAIYWLLKIQLLVDISSVEVCIELLGETVDSISGSEIGTRHKMGRHAAVTEIVAEKP